MYCSDHKLSRRSLLGAASGTFLGFQVRHLLALEGTSHPKNAEHVILFWNGGGMSHIDTWDPKPGRPTQGEFEAIQTSAPGVEISEVFPNLAKQMHHAALIRSIAGTQGAHERATYNLQTSYNQAANLIHPGLGSVLAHQKDGLGDLPAYVTVSGQAPCSSYLGQDCEAFFVGNPGERDLSLAFPEGIVRERGNKRLQRLTRFNCRFATNRNDEKLVATATSIDDAARLMRSPALKAFDLDKVPASTLNRYGDTPFGRGAILAKQLVETGVRFVQVNRGGFDTHTNNFPAMRNHGSVMDPALASLVEDLAETGMLENTLVVMLSEFGRTPRINDNAGRDHFPSVFSCFMAGGGIRGGTVVGSSDKNGEKPAERPVHVPDLHATLCHALGIDSTKEVMTPLLRPMKLVDGGTPIGEMFG
ncbi:MAG TPA: DUF1501 domain-containing protein [Pirellulaceae bacterium]|nr:DUF1501 domain-containing protein [Pirellulaceae bacterium]